MTGASLCSLLGSHIEDLVDNGRALLVASDLSWGEGPAYLAAKDLWIFSDIPNNRVLSYSSDNGLAIFRSPSNFANGHFPTRAGGFLACEHLTRRVTMTDSSDNTAIVCDHFEGRRLNSPNDVVEDSKGAIWFTDPTYGILTDNEGKRANPEQSKNRVYRVDPVFGVTGEIDCLSMPNGLTFSPDGRTLYVADSGAELGPEIGFEPTGPRDVYAFSIGSNGRVAGSPKHFCTVRTGVPDGMRCDRDGNLWIATGEGLLCHAFDGSSLGSIATSRTASNLAFGGARFNEVFVTTETSAYLLRL